MIKNLVKHGNSYALVIDQSLMQLLGIEPDAQLKLEIQEGTLRIEPIRVGKFRANLELIQERRREQVRLLQNLMVAMPGADAEPMSDEVAAQVRKMALENVYSDPAPLTKFEQGLMLEQVLDEIFGFGPLGPFLRDPVVENPIEMMPDYSWWSQGRRLPIQFDNNHHRDDVLRKLKRQRGRTTDDGMSMEYIFSGRKVRVPISDIERVGN